MKIVLILALAMLVQPAFAKPLLFSKIEKYIDIKTYKVIELSDFDMNGDGTASYRDYTEKKKITISLEELARETTKEIAGVKAGELLLVESGKGLVLCETYTVFENGSAQIGCRNGKMSENIGIDRPAKSNHTLLTVEQSGVVAEIESLEGLKKKDRVYLNVETTQIAKGALVKVIAVFANGDVAVEQVGLGFLDTSSPLMKSGVIKVKISQLEVKNAND